MLIIINNYYDKQILNKEFHEVYHFEMIFKLNLYN